MKNIGFVILFFSAVQAYSQEYTAFSLCATILHELSLTDIRYYTSLEHALEKYPAPINMEIHRYKNEHNKNLFDNYYVLNYNDYELALVKYATSQRYYPNSISIFIPENQPVNSLLPYREYDFYIVDNAFGKLILNDENTLIYEISENWMYLNIIFENGIIRKIVILFHNE